MNFKMFPEYFVNPPVENNVMDPDELCVEIAKMAEKYGYHFTVGNGQRRFGPPINCKKGPPPRGSEVFIAHIPRSANELELIPMLIKLAPIYLFRIMINFSKSNRGFAFCKFYTPEDAAAAVTALNNLELQEYSPVLGQLLPVKLGAVLSHDKTTLSIYPVPPEVTLNQINKLLLTLEIEENCVQFIGKDEKTYPRGVKWIITFDEHRSAAIARRKLELHKNCWSTNFTTDYHTLDSKTNGKQSVSPPPPVPPSHQQHHQQHQLLNLPLQRSNGKPMVKKNFSHSKNRNSKGPNNKMFPFLPSFRSISYSR